MIKVSKRDLILDSIIQAYLSDNAPIGSSELGSRMGMSIPASTIRVYFKKLSDEGAITQFHVSGGRIPTAATMRDYWRARLNFDETLNIANPSLLKLLSDKFEIYAMVFESKAQTLNEVLNLNNRFLILSFSEDEIALKFNSKVEKFLGNLIGIDLGRLELTCMQVGLNELRNKIAELKRSKIRFLENERVALEIFGESFKNALSPSFEMVFDSNLVFFSENYLGMKLDVNFGGKEAKMLCAGSIYNDYERFLNNLKEAA